MFKKLSDITNLMKTVSQLGDRLHTMKAKLAEKRVYGRAADGEHSVSVELSGIGYMTKLDVSPSLLAPEHKGTIERLTMEATNKAVVAAKELLVASIHEITGGMNLPGMDGLLSELAK